ncbi:MAG TPA: PTS mannitol transporter subunit IICB [Pseudonocardiaceae bacterium]|jgi:PTS system mannitol-specific IIC component|nr:PTS mannitol transporter subunit IICB [Pseudonocardiaceae bacterium]
MTTSVETEEPGGWTRVRNNLQRFGGQMAAMVLPNIGAFIAWGLITALFIPTGWIPNATLGALVNPMIDYLLPLLIGYTGGRLVHGQRGAVIGAIATIGVVVGTDVPMFLGAMIVGPLSAFVLKIWDDRVGSKTAPGFKMLVDNFSCGIIGGIFAVLGVLGIGPAVGWLSKIAGDGVQALINVHLLPLASIIIEPAKVLFLNNAINHGILEPIGVQQAAAHGGKAIEFLMETNPGPGLGVLAACLFFGPKAMRGSVPGAMVIQFLGGIHEIYFPYILARPKLVLAAIAGGATGVLTFVVTGVGTTATPSPGSIFAVLALTPKGNFLGIIAGVVLAAAVSFVVGAALFGFGRAERGSDDEFLLEEKQKQSKRNKRAGARTATAAEV